MIEHSITLKIIGTTFKMLLYPAVVWLFYPLYDLVVPIVVSDYALLSPYTKLVLDDVKIILGTLIAIFALVKLIYGVIKIKKEVAEK